MIRLNNNQESSRISEFLTIGEAAEELGVSRSTLRNWDRAGKVIAYRHPVNGYRLYSRQYLLELLNAIERTSENEESENS